VGARVGLRRSRAQAPGDCGEWHFAVMLRSGKRVAVPGEMQVHQAAARCLPGQYVAPLIRRHKRSPDRCETVIRGRYADFGVRGGVIVGRCRQRPGFGGGNGIEGVRRRALLAPAVAERFDVAVPFNGSLRFHRVAAPKGEELSQLVHRLAQRIARHLERQGLLQRDVENDYLTEDAFEADALTPLHSASITYRIALGPQQGRKVFTLQTLLASEDDLPSTVGKEAGFSPPQGALS